MRNAELYLKEATVITPRALQPLAARLPELAPKLERLDCSNWFYSEQRREYQSKLSTSHSSGERWYEIAAVNFAEVTGDRY